MEYYSQYGQDKFIDKHFNKKEEGVFLDIGAHDGVRLSNTYFFEKERNWKGICFEPNPKVFKELDANRKCIKIQGAAGKENGEFDFLQVEGLEMLSGLVDKYDPRHLERIEKDTQKTGNTTKNIIKVKCYNVNELLEKHNMTDIDYCSIDTEGGEFEIIKSIDLDRINIKTFTVENNYREENVWKKFWKKLTKNSIEGYLNSKGYKLIANLHADDVYERKTNS